MTKHQGTNQFFFRLVILFRKNYDRKRSSNSLVSTTGITHHRNHGSCHTGITCSRCVRKNVRKCIASHDTLLTAAALQGFSQFMPIISFKRTFRRL